MSTQHLCGFWGSKLLSFAYIASALTAEPCPQLHSSISSNQAADSYFLKERINYHLFNTCYIVCNHIVRNHIISFNFQNDFIRLFWFTNEKQWLEVDWAHVAHGTWCKLLSVSSFVLHVLSYAMVFLTAENNNWEWFSHGAVYVQIELQVGICDSFFFFLVTGFHCVAHTWPGSSSVN